MAGEKVERKTVETPGRIIEEAIASGALTREEAWRSRVILEHGYLPIMGGMASEREWKQVAQLTGKAGELVREFRGTTSIRKRGRLAGQLNKLIGEEETRWDERTRYQAQTAYHYMTGEIQEAEREKKRQERERGEPRKKGARPEDQEGVSEAWGKARRRLEVDHYEEVETDEGRFWIPVYKGLTLDGISEILRDYFDEVILSNRHIRDASIEHQASFGLVWSARSLVTLKERDEEATAEEKEEARRKAEEIRMEYDSVRRALNWWHEAARDKNGGFSKGKDTFSNGIAWGGKFGGEYIAWLKDSYRGRDFVRGFATPRVEVNNTDFTNASEMLGAMLRSSCGIGTKDEVTKPGQRKPKEKAGAEFLFSDGTRAKVINAKGEILARTKATNSYMYETHKQCAMDGYAYKYLEVRHKMMDTIFEFSHIDLETGEPVYICHISADRLWAYDAFQHPKFLAPLWYANLDVLPDESKRQLGWQQLDDDSQEDTRLNKILLGTGDNFLSENVSPENRQKLCQRLGLAWDEAWSLEQKMEVLLRLGMIRRFGDRTWGMKEHYRLTTALIDLNTEEISEDVWWRMDWSPLRKIGGAFLSDWCQQMDYLQHTRNNILGILTGDKVAEGLEFLGSGIGFRHIPDIISPVAERERNWWYEVINNMELLTLRRYREKGNRHNLAKLIRARIPEGFLRAYFRRVWFAACGIRNMDWSDNIGTIQTFQKVKQFLQGVNEVKVVRDGMLRDKGVTYRDLAAFAGLKIKPFHRELIYHYDLIHMLSDEEGWDTEENIETLRLMAEFIDDYLDNYDKSLEIIGAAGERVKERWIKERPEEARKILGIFEEWETEVDLPLMSRFLTEFFRQGFFDGRTDQERRDQRRVRIAWIENWIKTHRADAERIMQVWPEFEEMAPGERRAWLRANPDRANKVTNMTVDWPGRSAWGWGMMVEGRPATGSEELEMTLWVACEDYVANFYERQRWPWRRYGARFNLWEREERVFRVVRRQKPSMDSRPDELKKKQRLADGRMIHAPEDIIVGRWHYDQLEWNPVTNTLERHDRQGDPFRGIDRLKSMMMTTGEYYPGDPREAGPLWCGYNARRYLYRFASRFSVWYHIEHAKLAAKVHGYRDWKEYWREHQVARLVVAPSKWYKILRILTLTGTIDPDEHVPYLRAFGATLKEVIAYWAERKGLRLPDEQDVVKGEVAPEIGKFATLVAAELKGAPGSPILSILTGGRTGAEIGKMVRNSVLLGTATSVGLDTALFVGGIVVTGTPGGLGFAMIPAGLAGFIVGALAGWDRGDLVGGMAYVLGRFGGFLGERLERSDPEALALGYTPLRILGARLPRTVERRLVPWFPPPVNDDVQSSEDIAQAIAQAKAELGGEGPKGK